ncbi:MAG: MOSC domain-containing protein [Burkholderiales bacterium]
MPILTQLNLYPIKSCAGISLRKATATAVGLMSEGIRDREWMVVDSEGNFLTQREYPAMARIIPRLKTDSLELQAPGMARLEIPLSLPDPDHAPVLNVKVWDDTLIAYDCDDPTAVWFSKAIGSPCRLARFHPHAKRVANRKWTGGAEVQTLFADGFPMLIISEASLEDLNQKLLAEARAPLPMNRFRPNLVISGVDAFEEDYAALIQLGDAQLQPVKPCPRCPIPSIDQATGVIGPDPLDILQRYRANPTIEGGIAFGMNAILLGSEDKMLEVGQEARIELAFS